MGRWRRRFGACLILLSVHGEVEEDSLAVYVEIDPHSKVAAVLAAARPTLLFRPL